MITKRLYVTDKQAFEAIREGRDIAIKRNHFEADGFWVENTHHGLVLEVGEHNGRDDSDFFAVVWDREARAPREIVYGTTRAHTYDNDATVDATPEVLAAYDGWQREQALLRAQRLVEREARTVRKGKTVRVTGGRKVPLGTTGVVFWIGTGHRNRVRVGLTDASGEAYWTDVANVEVVLETQAQTLSEAG